MVSRIIDGRCFALVLATVSMRSAAAQEAAFPLTPQSLSLAEALERAGAHAPDVTISRRAVSEVSARGVGLGTRVAENPRLTLEARPPLYGGGTFPEDTRYAAQLGILLDVGGAPGARVAENAAAIELAQGDVALRVLDARAAAYVAYVHARLAERRVLDLKSLQEIAERVNEASKLRSSAGSAGDIEVSLSTSELFEIRAQLGSAERERERATMDLRAALDIDARAPVGLTTTLDAPAPPPALDMLLQNARTRRPEMALLDKREKFLDATQARLERERAPRVGFYVGVDHAPISPAFGQVGAVIEIPAFLRNRGPLAEVAAQQGTGNERRAIVERQIVREVTNARAAYVARLAELAIVVDNVVPQAQRTLALVEIGWRAGRFDVFRVTSAARDLSRAKGLALAALEASFVDGIALQKAVGEVSP